MVSGIVYKSAVFKVNGAVAKAGGCTVEVSVSALLTDVVVEVAVYELAFSMTQLKVEGTSVTA